MSEPIILFKQTCVAGGGSIFHKIICKFASITESIPFSEPFWRYVYNSHQDDPIRTVMEIGLVFFALHYIFAKTYRIDSKNEVKLTEKEIDELIDEWEPEPLVDELTPFEKLELSSIPLLNSEFGSKQKLKDGKVLLNLASFNFLGMLNTDKIKEKAIETVKEYGVGTCGPTGFYGTLDIHVQLEKDIAKFLGTEAAILYSQGFSTLSSVIPCYSKRGDLIICDEGVNFSIQKGVQISRSNVRYFKHNDMEDLERVLAEIRKEDQKAPHRLVPRRFIITEGIFYNTGDLCPLPQIVQLKHEYKYRLIVDESLSFGILGSRGAGITDHYNLPISDIDIISGSLCNSISASGGFAASTADIIERQRLAGQSYVFSASLPAALTIAGIEGVKELVEEGPAKLQQLREHIQLVHKALAAVPYYQPLTTDQYLNSPVIHLRLLPYLTQNLDLLAVSQLLQEVIDECIKDGVLLTRAKYHPTQELRPINPSIRYNVTTALSPKELEKSIATLKLATYRVLNKKKLV